MDDFKVPSDIPQDLLLIQSIIGIAYQHTELPLTPADSSSSVDSIASSGSEVDSEDEIETALVVEEVKVEEEDIPKVLTSDSDSDSDCDSDSTSSSELSDDESTNGDTQTKDKNVVEQDMDEEDSNPSPAIQSYFQTKNEVLEYVINVPDIDKLGQDEDLEKVGEIMNIVENVVIVKGSPLETANRGAEKALDTDTLLFFDDRKVLGYIYETFGPTTQPLYQVRFNSAYPLNPEKVRVSREVFHAPQRSNFVFTRQIAVFKGSDASNMNDEEPAEYELEFSDDEAEAEYKRNYKKKRGGSRVSSRQSTPIPARVRDQDLNDDYHMGKNAFAEIGPYDIDYGGLTPSRPAPRPYDDPYSDEFSVPSSITPASSSTRSSASQSRSVPGSRFEDEMRSRVRGSRGRGRGSRRGSAGMHDRSQSRDRTPSEVRYNNVHSSYPPTPQHHTQHTQQYQFPLPHPQQQMPQLPYPPNTSAGIQSSGMSYQQSFVQPHINPWFASQFGMPMNFGQMQHSLPGMHPEHFISASPATNAVSHWSGEWIVHDSSDQGGPVNEDNAEHR